MWKATQSKLLDNIQNIKLLNRKYNKQFKIVFINWKKISNWPIKWESYQNEKNTLEITKYFISTAKVRKKLSKKLIQ